MEHMGRQKEAIAQYEKALAVTPSSTFVLGRLADLYKREGRVQKSEQAWRAYHQYQQRVETDTKKVKARL
jgi:tetratricopeptide (TPR) repeat protein